LNVIQDSGQHVYILCKILHYICSSTSHSLSPAKIFAV
jgi:hypothetical protein